MSTPVNPVTDSPLSSQVSSVGSAAARAPPTPMTPLPLTEDIEMEEPAADDLSIAHSESVASTHAPVSASVASSQLPPVDVFHAASVQPTLSASALTSSAEEDLHRKKTVYLNQLQHYLGAWKIHPSADHTRVLYHRQKEAEALFKETQEVLKTLNAVNNPPSMPDDKKFSLVPSNMPFLQLTSDTVLEKPKREAFDSVYDFAHEFVTVLEARSLSLYDHWEHLLPMCLNKDDRSWFGDELKNKMFNWKEAEDRLFDRLDTPFRKFLNMGRVWIMKQEKGESARLFGSKFQKYQIQACLEDGVQLVLCFWWNLLPEVREACSIPLSAMYGAKMPEKIEDIISLVVATTADRAPLQVAPNSAANAWNNYASKNGAAAGQSGNKRRHTDRGSDRGGDAKRSGGKDFTFKMAMKEKSALLVSNLG